ncbi:MULTISPECIES: hypothetical protein [Bacillus]|uniref:hypothetical protein n=1 Tax=Bacillus TaxID=1386 RepID=UPI0003049842|nr:MULTISPECIES: hypothetical protein [Bacillus]
MNLVAQAQAQVHHQAQAHHLVHHQAQALVVNVKRSIKEERNMVIKNTNKY